VHASVPRSGELGSRRALPLRVSPGALVLAAALPILFLHVDYQPGVSLDVAGVSATAYLSDFAVLAVVAAAAAAARRDGVARLRDGLATWVVGASFFLWLAFELAHGSSALATYDTGKHAISAAKFAEYGLLAPAAVLLVRRLDDLRLLLWSLTLWCSAATVVALAQFFGADVALANHVGSREASFVGYSDYAALAVAVTVAGVVALVAPRLGLGRGLAAATLPSGILGVVLAGSIAAALGLATGAALLGIVLVARRELSPRHALAATAAVGVAVLGAAAIRGNDLHAFARFVGASDAPRRRAEHIQTYSQRTLLGWIGFEIWKRHPLLGVGWEGSAEPSGFEPVLPAAHRRFPDLAALAFPSAGPDRRYGVQNSWLQALADLGVVGFLLWVATFVVAGGTALRASLSRLSAPGLFSLACVGALFWLWAAQGFYAGIPLDALTALVFGLAATRLVDA
jgi:O-antigen ligase